MQEGNHGNRREYTLTHLAFSQTIDIVRATVSKAFLWLETFEYETKLIWMIYSVWSNWKLGIVGLGNACRRAGDSHHLNQWGCALIDAYNHNSPWLSDNLYRIPRHADQTSAGVQLKCITFFKSGKQHWHIYNSFTEGWQTGNWFTYEWTYKTKMTQTLDGVKVVT